MGNVICLSDQISDPKNFLLSMSNGLTDVFISVLLLSGSQLAKDENEKRLIVWLLNGIKVQSVWGQWDFLF